VNAVKKNSPLYDALKTWLGQSVPWAHRGHLTTCLWMVMALLQRGEVSLTRWLPYIPCRGVQAQSKPRRLSRSPLATTPSTASFGPSSASASVGIGWKPP